MNRLAKTEVVGGTLRLIEVPGFDLSACGGSHVARTGAIGIISVLRVMSIRNTRERYRQTFGEGSIALIRRNTLSPKGRSEEDAGVSGRP